MARINLNEYIERKREEKSIEIELPDGSTVVMPPAELWSDAARAVLGDPTRRAEAIRLLLGDEQADRFTAAGGSFAILNGIYMEQQGIETGEAPASSTS